ncbi:MAG: HD domain-containing protein [Vicinamibacteria bacterium]|nr:HD domain-containing protein [Vicinamibacteria bacterium]
MPSTEPIEALQRIESGKSRGSILSALLGLLFLTAFLPLVLTSRYLVNQARADLELDQRSLQIAKVRHLSESVAQFRATTTTIVHTLATSLAIDAPADYRKRIDSLGATRTLEAFPGDASSLVSVNVVDRRGFGARSGLALPEAALNQGIQRAFAAGLKGESTTTAPQWSTTIAEPVVISAEPVLTAHGPAQAVVIAITTLEPIVRLTRQSGEGGLLDVYVVSAEGRLVAHSDPKFASTGTDLNDIDIVREFVSAGGRAAASMPFTIKDNAGGVRNMLATFVRVADDSGWGVIAQIDEEKAYAGANAMRRNSALVVGLVSLFALSLGFWLSGELTRPIRTLRDAALQLARGDFKTRVRVTARNEVGVLADTFNIMGERIERAVAEILEAAQTNRELFIGTIRMLANAIDAKDPYTRGHSERVAYYSTLVARELGMSETEIENVHLAGLIHDVGKIGIEDRILRKPSALTDDEYEIMKQHPTKGAQILEAVPKLKALAGPGLMHHENVDGSGYPDGLKGDEIPLLGRMVSVADAFDAMTTDRPYSKAMTFEASVARLQFLSGKKFDPQCVDAMARAVASGELTSAKARVAALAARRDGPPLKSVS